MLTLKQNRGANWDKEAFFGRRVLFSIGVLIDINKFEGALIRTRVLNRIITEIITVMQNVLMITTKKGKCHFLANSNAVSQELKKCPNITFTRILTHYLICS